MTVLTMTQIENGYFNDVGGFPPLRPLIENRNFAREVSDYKGQKKLCITCTQLEGGGYTKLDQKRILSEWIDFLQKNPDVLVALHFNSRVPQALFDAACCQRNLVELRFKWGSYKDLSALKNLKKLQFLYIGSGAGITDIQDISRLESLVALHVENFKRIDDYSPLAALGKLEQLVISGPILGTTPVKDLEFLRNMPWLRSIWLRGVSLRTKYTAEELTKLRNDLPSLNDIAGSVFGAAQG